MMAAGLDYKDRVKMLVEYTEALVEMYMSREMQWTVQYENALIQPVRVGFLRSSQGRILLNKRRKTLQELTFKDNFMFMKTRYQKIS